MDIELQRNNSIQKRPVGQSMKKFQRNTGRILPNAEPVSIVLRSSSDALGGQGRMLDVWMLDLFGKRNMFEIYLKRNRPSRSSESRGVIPKRDSYKVKLFLGCTRKV